MFGASLSHVFDHWAGQYLYALLGAAWVFGNAQLVRKEKVLACLEHDILTLGSFRVAQRSLLALANKRRVWFVNTHLHDGREDHKCAIRVVQVRMHATVVRIVVWIGIARLNRPCCT
jgi:hypothetical protein